MTGIWIITTASLALFIEIFAGNAGLAVPMLGLTAFYLFVACDWEKGVIPLAVAAVILDSTLGRSSFISLLLLAPIGVLAYFWRRRGECGRATLQALPGLAVGLMWGTLLLTVESLVQERISVGLLRHDAWLLMQFILFGIIGLPLICRAADYAASRLGLPLYVQAQQARRMRHG
ncbi:MAG: hypothetical protein K9N51_06800 [Candidatus Pacebacteria bacterium]|nr:hypothetical protein [Candidatus Paceibacterota bacterium]